MKQYKKNICISVLITLIISIAYTFSCVCALADFDSSIDQYAVFSKWSSSKYGSSTTAYLVFDLAGNTFYAFSDKLFEDSVASMRKGIYSGSFEGQIDLDYDDSDYIVSFDAHKGELSRTIESVFKNKKNTTEKYSIQNENDKYSVRTEALELLEKYFETKEKQDAYESTLSEKYPIVNFGSYEQDNNSENGKESIKWLVLEQHSDYSLLLSLYVLDFQKAYDHTKVEHLNLWRRWGGSTIRQWLNNDFYNSAFSIEEQIQINNTLLSLKYPRELRSGAPTEETTVDKIFLLGKDEALQYFEGDELSANKTDAFLGLFARTRNGYYKWLTLSEQSLTRWYCIEENRCNTVEYNDEVGIRPAIWVSTNWLKSINPDFN